MPRSPFIARGTPFALSPRPFISCESRAFPSALPPFIYSLAKLALRNPKRFSFSDYLSLSPVLPRFAARVFRAESHLCPMLYHYHDIAISIRFNRVIDVQCLHRAISHAMRSSALCALFELLSLHLFITF